MAVKFKAPTKHGAQTFVPATSLAFDDERAEDYFIAAGFAEATDDEPVMTYEAGTVEIDPETIFADGPNKGNLVMEG